MSPHISVAQKNPSILHEIQRFLGIGRVYQRDVHACGLEIRANEEVRRFIDLMKDRVKVKSPQLKLLADFLEIQMPQGGVLRFGPYTKEQTLRMLEIAERVRQLNGDKGHLIEELRKQVSSVDQNAYMNWWSNRERAPKKLKPDILQTLYWKEHLSLKQIGYKLGCHADTVRRAMLAAGVPRRSKSEAFKNRFRNLTSGQFTAYQSRIARTKF